MLDATMEGVCWANGPTWKATPGNDRMSAGRRGSPEVTVQASIITHDPRSGSSC